MKSVLIFDYDGVIVDSLDIFMKLFITACQKYNWNQISTKQEFLKLFNGNMYEHMKQIGMTTQDILHIVGDVKIGLLTHLEDLPLIPDITKALDTLEKKNHLIISTSNESTVVKQFLSVHNLTHFKEIYGSDIHPSKTKKIHMIQQQYPTNTYVYIGDTMGDILEGKKAGIYTIAVTWGWHTKHQLQQSNPDFLAETPSALIDIVNGLS